ncbi:MAG: hypothetical protein QOK23_4064 [Gammaproteobacteria bacterium]|nr:hypothetical protein [Gammaproteobacteria bacterium]
MALVFVIGLLIGGLATLRIRDDVRAHRSLGGRLLLHFRRRRDRFVLTYRAVILIVGVIRVVVRDAAPPKCRVIERQRREIQPKSKTTEATPPETIVKPAIAVVESVTAIMEAMSTAAVESTTAAVEPTTVVACSQRDSAAQRQCPETSK